MTERIPEWTDIEELDLDPGNYRLPADLGLTEQADLLVYLERHFDLDEVGESMAVEGFRPEEPVVGVREGDRIVIVEGNRRLATTLLLTSAEKRALLERPARREYWEQLATKAAEAADNGGWSLTKLPVVLYEERSQVLGSLGFRHVSGIAQWSSESKARYIADLLDQGLSAQDVARKIGSRADYIRRQATAHRALQEAEEGGVDIERPERRFGVYYRALSNRDIREFVGLRGWSDELDADDTSVFENGVDGFRDFISVIFGSEERPPAITDSRQIDKVGRALSTPEAAEYLIKERDLDEALRIAGGDRASFQTDLRGALERLRRANGEAFEHAGDEDLLDLARRCVETARRLVEQLEGTDTQAEHPDA